MYKVGNWNYNEKTGVLISDSESRKLEPKLKSALALLIRSDGRVVSYEEMRRTLWPDRIVTDNSLYKSIAMLRKKLDDDMQEPRYIVNIPKMGYRFIAVVDRIDQSGRRLVDEQLASDEDATHSKNELSGPNEHIAKAGVSLSGLSSSKSRMKMASLGMVGLVAVMLLSVLTYSWIDQPSAYHLCLDIEDERFASSTEYVLDQAAALSGIRFLIDRVPETGSCLSRLTSVGERPEVIVSSIGDLLMVSGIDEAGRLSFLRLFDHDSLTRGAVSDLIVGSSLRGTGAPVVKNNQHPLEVRAQFFVLEKQKHKLSDSTHFGSIEEVESNYLTIISQYPDYVNGYAGLAGIYLDVGRMGASAVRSTKMSQAINLINRGAEVDPMNALLLSKVGYLFEIKQEYEAAVVFQQMASVLDERDPHPYLRLAALASATGKTDEAYAYASLAYHLAPHLEEVTLVALEVSLDAAQLDFLRTVSETTLSTEGLSSELYLAVGDLNSQVIDHMELAIDAVSKVLSQQPDHVGGVLVASRLLTIFGQPDLALAVFEELGSAGTSSIDDSINAALMVSEYLGEPDRALPFLEHGSQQLNDGLLSEFLLDMHYLSLNRARGKVYLALGQFEESYKWFTEAEQYLNSYYDVRQAWDIAVSKMYITQRKDDQVAFGHQRTMLMDLIDQTSDQEAMAIDAALALACYYQLTGEQSEAKRYLSGLIQRGSSIALALQHNAIVSELLQDPVLMNQLQSQFTQLDTYSEDMQVIRAAVEQFLALGQPVN